MRTEEKQRNLKIVASEKKNGSNDFLLNFKGRRCPNSEIQKYTRHEVSEEGGVRGEGGGELKEGGDRVDSPVGRRRGGGGVRKEEAKNGEKVRSFHLYDEWGEGEGESHEKEKNG